jgi:hypothetical protein
MGKLEVGLQEEVRACERRALQKEKATRQGSPSLDEGVGVRQPKRMTSIVSVASVEHVCRRGALAHPVRRIRRRTRARRERLYSRELECMLRLRWPI